MSELDTVLELLQKPLADDPGILAEQARDIEGYYARIVYQLAEAKYQLSLACAAKLLPKTKEVSEQERQVQLAAATATERRYVEQLEGLTKAISRRIVFAQSLLKTYMQERGSRI